MPWTYIGHEEDYGNTIGREVFIDKNGQTIPGACRTTIHPDDTGGWTLPREVEVTVDEQGRIID